MSEDWYNGKRYDGTGGRERDQSLGRRDHHQRRPMEHREPAPMLQTVLLCWRSRLSEGENVCKNCGTVIPRYTLSDDGGMR